MTENNNNCYNPVNRYVTYGGYDIAISSDSNFCKHVAVLMLSILHTNPNVDVTFHFLSLGCADEDIQKLKELLKKYSKASIEVYNISSNSFSGFRTTSQYSIATYARFLLPDLLKNKHKVLYLDVDMIVNGSLEELWNTDIRNHSAAMSLDGNKYILPRIQSYLEYDVVADGYFNAGMILMNLDWWREKEISKKCMETALSRNDLTFLDQDAINLVLHGTIKEVSPKWNFIQGTYYHYPLKCLDKLRKSIHKYWFSARIIHFTCSFKPWFKNSVVPHTDKYLYYRAMTPWKDEPLQWSTAERYIYDWPNMNPIHRQIIMFKRRVKYVVAYLMSVFY